MLHALKNRFGRRQKNLWRNLLYAMLSASQHGNGYLTHKHVQLKISFIAIPLYMLSIRLIIFKVMNSCVCCTFYSCLSWTKTTTACDDEEFRRTANDVAKNFGIKLLSKRYFIKVYLHEVVRRFIILYIITLNNVNDFY